VKLEFWQASEFDDICIESSIGSIKEEIKTDERKQ
jgi:hypothetical protein